MKKNWPKEIVNLSLLVFIFIISGISWPFVSNNVPIHWNIMGQVDRYGNKFEGLFILPLLALALTFFTTFVR